MKKLLFMACAAIATFVHAQNSVTYLSYSYKRVLSYSVKITYSSTGTYQPYYGSQYSSSNVLNTLQSRYNQNRGVVEIEYGKLINLELVNKSNISTLEYYKNYIVSEINIKSGSADFSRSSVTNSYIEFITQPFKLQTIKDEIKLLQSCQSELERIQYTNPDNYIYSKRYQAIVKTLEVLESCDPSKIRELSWENMELNNLSHHKNNDRSVYYKIPNTNVFYQSSHSSIQIDKIYKTDKYLIITLTTFPSEKYINGGWVNFGPNAYILQDSKRYYLIKAENIPLSPNKHYFNNKNERLTFHLFFDKSISIDARFDIYEGIEGGFNFYNISG